MSTFRSQGQQGGNWKDKYFKTLFELDEKDKQWAERVIKLQKSLLRLALSHYGESPELDKQINMLANAVRGGQKESIQKLVDGVVNAVVVLDESRVASNARDGVGTLAQLIDSLPVMETEEPAWSALRARLDSAHGDAELKDIITQCAALLGKTLSKAATTAPTVQPESPADVHANTLQRGAMGVANQHAHVAEPLLHFLDNLQVPEACAPSVEAVRKCLVERRAELDLLIRIDALAAALSRTLADTQSADADGRIPPGPIAANGILLELLERMPFPGELTQQVEAIKVVLNRSASNEELERAVGHIVELVRAMTGMLQAEIQEMERFLKNVNVRLQQIARYVDGPAVARAAAAQDRGNMLRAVEADLQRIRSGMADATDLQELKLSIEEHLQTIDVTMETFVHAEARRAREAEIAVTDLHEQLQLLERETNMLRDSIREEHGRALRDALTGVPNRLAYEERIALEYARWKRQDNGLSVVLIDIDYFKRINDTYGHQAGDRVLKTVASQLARHVRDTDFFGRFGGEEFVLLLPNTRLPDALRVAEKLRANIEACHFHHRAEPVAVTVSCGLAEFHEGDTPEDVFRRADESLYLAKREGRNRCSHEEELQAA